ncbi:Hypp7921 [Branchiostoma lanceolatum]|uniref:Hypp7921 protein n=1 Tax=Branchiostoma lanceolatum TaxID=7740 RepID=A0A8J9Z587_BRALA|nr:Hypp7921 [Branchiostoma lanceolatum]
MKRSVPPGSSALQCLISMNGQLTPATCDEARQFICETTGTPGAENEDDEAAREEGYDICEEPMGIQCQNLRTGDILEDGQTGPDGLVCDLETGAQCDYK